MHDAIDYSSLSSLTRIKERQDEHILESEALLAEMENNGVEVTESVLTAYVNYPFITIYMIWVLTTFIFLASISLSASWES